MNETNIVICDKDLQYGKSLVQAFQRANEFMASYIILSEKEKVLPYIKENSVELFLIEQEAYEEVVQRACNELDLEEKKQLLEKIIVITDSKEMKYDEVSVLYKYQPVTAILGPVKQKLLVQEKQKKTEHLHAKIFAVLSLGSNDNSSLIGHMIAKGYSEEHNVLLVNMEVFPFLYGEQETPYSLSDYIYGVVSDSEMTGQIAEGMQYRNGRLSCVSPITSFPDLYELKEEKMTAFLQQLQRESQAEIIVLVLDFLQPFTLALLTVCDRIISAEPVSYVENKKREQFCKMLALEEKEWIQDKIIYSNIATNYLLANISETGELSEELKGSIRGWLMQLWN